ncbi:MAG: twin-arginine translocase subunit TatC [bacterium]|nr:twin-arginine translocase subunit TatC [bacterium]
MNKSEMTFVEHLEELRRAFLKSFLALIGGTAVCLGFSPQIYRWIQQPLEAVLPEGAHFIVTTPFEAYWTYFKISLVFGFFLSTPLIFYFFWSFLTPGLHSHEKKGILPIALISSALFVGGALFGYFVVFPTGFHFAVKILADTDIHFFPKMSDYLSLALRLLIAFGIIFELPLFLFILGKLGLVRADGLRRARKYVIVGIFLVAGVLTPGPDILSQILMALPLLLLFEVGVLLVKLTQPRKNPVVAGNTTP